jgi:hypothetical protein
MGQKIAADTELDAIESLRSDREPLERDFARRGNLSRLALPGIRRLWTAIVSHAKSNKVWTLFVFD